MRGESDWIKCSGTSCIQKVDLLVSIWNIIELSRTNLEVRSLELMKHGYDKGNHINLGLDSYIKPGIFVLRMQFIEERKSHPIFAYLSIFIS